jgi:hypothetical protein
LLQHILTHAWTTERLTPSPSSPAWFIPSSSMNALSHLILILFTFGGQAVGGWGLITKSEWEFSLFSCWWVCGPKPTLLASRVP